ncbi:MAG TPA: right-handed parallel beta-helix repeat-containing protein [Xanthomonadaceae bacterium]|nr:right-handed parallel beta-helix repeat-containing protein [Xanthomonadaceae bacterium]
MNQRASLLTALLLVATGAMADGTIELNHDCALAGCVPGDDPGYPITLVEGGQYRLSSDLLVPASSMGIYFDAPNARFVLDMSGFAIRGPYTCAGVPVSGCSGPGSAQSGIVLSSSARGGHLRNGVVSGFGGFGVDVDIDGSFELENVEFSQNALGGARLDTQIHNILARHSRFLRNGGTGLTSPFTSTLGTVIEDSLFYGNQGIGAEVTYGSIARSSFISNGSFGAVGGIHGCVLHLNRFRGNNGGAAQFASCAHVDNVCGTGPC